MSPSQTATSAQAAQADPTPSHSAAAVNLDKALSDQTKAAKRAEFIAKLRRYIAAIKDATQRQRKMIAMKGMLAQRADHLHLVAIMKASDVNELTERSTATTLA